MKSVRYFVYKVLFFVAAFNLSAEQFVPNPILHANFLVFPYKQQSRTVVAIKDPYCVYCNAAIKELHKLENLNIYVFWADIIDERSPKRVEQILSCAHPSVLSVLHQVANNEHVNCDDGNLAKNIRVNTEAIYAYSPSVVPLYYMDGKSVSFKELKEYSTSLKKVNLDKSPIMDLDWNRYDKFRIGDYKMHKPNIGIVLPSDYPFHDFPVTWLDIPEHNVFVFWQSDKGDISAEVICIKNNNCAESIDGYTGRLLEFYELLGIPIENNEVLYFSDNLRLIEPTLREDIPTAITDLF